MIPTKGTGVLKNNNWIAFSKARRVIAKASCIGQILLSEKVVVELEALESDLWHEDFRANDENYYPNTSEESEAIAQHAKNIEKLIKPRLKTIINYAKNNLK